MQIQFHADEIREIVRQVVAEVLAAIDWPTGRLTLTEVEAAAACGVARHVLRDLRLAGAIKARRIGRKAVYTRTDLLAALEVVQVEAQSVNVSHRPKRKGRSDVA